MKKFKQYLAFLVVLLMLGGLFYVAWFGVTDKSGEGEVKKQVGSMHDIKFGLDLAGGASITYKVEGKDGKTPTSQEMDDTVSKLQKRVESELGTTEASVYKEGNDRITVEIPGATDKIFETLSTPGNLYFIREYNSDGKANYQRIYGTGILSEGVTIDSLKNNGGIVLEGSDIANARAGINNESSRKYVVELSLTSEGTKKFAEATTEAAKKGWSIGIYYDGKFVSVPTVNEAITTGKAEISGMESYEEAENIASTIRIGGLDVSLKELRANVVGAQLGSSAIHTSKRAAEIGFVFIVLFMLIVYRVLGVSASIALGFYCCLEVILLSAFEVTLTLPGIAGIILSIGMAVDANVLVFARIREEIASGTPVDKAIGAGYNKALSAILDGNITTLIAALVLGIGGTGSIRGFAITLALGIIVSMFTALFITRIITRIIYNLGFKDVKFYGKAKALKKIDFVQKRKVFYVISLAIAIAGIAVMGVNHSKGNGAFNYSIDFVGGTATTITFDSVPSIDKIEKEIEPAVMKAANSADKNLNVTSISHQVVEKEKQVILKTITLSTSASESVGKVLKDNYGAKDVTYETISATISNEMGRSAIVSTIIALVLMLIYIWFRFKDIRFGSSAIIALAHDAIMVIMCYAFSRIEVGSTFIAAVLTIIGYSINDTIVTFDRIRENQHGIRSEEELKSMVIDSINQTLSRSLFTSITTFIMVLSLFVVGVNDIRIFALPLMVGVVSGTYSSICIASQLWFGFKNKSLKASGAYKTVKAKKTADNLS